MTRRHIQPRRPVPVYLALWREKFGLTQEELGERIGQGVGKGTVSRWETDTRAQTAGVLAAYAEALGIPVSWLYRKPTNTPSLDEMIADKPEELQRRAAEMLEILLRTGR